MEVKDVIQTLKHALQLEEVNCKNRKNNINQHYELAKHDFRVIDNMEDCIETYRYVIEKLEDLQDRIIERNKERIF